MPLSLHSRQIDAPGSLLLLHGGAWDTPDGVLDEHRTGLRAALDAGEGLVERNRDALDIVTETVGALEDHEAFNAGYGAMLNQDGTAELDAGVMEGATLDYGAVMATQRLAHPVRVARRLLTEGEGRVRMLAGNGAERFAEAQGIELVSNEALVCPRERRRYDRIQAQAEADHPSRSFLPSASNLGGADTVGAVARTESGHLAAATSTGGTPFKPPGRVGDSPVPGAGFYADAHVAVSATGWGEAIAAVGLARDIRERVRDGTSAEPAARRSLRRMHEEVTSPDGEGATGGCIVVTPDDAACAFTAPRMARGWTDGERADWTIEKAEES
ncbi:MAG: isoaspartyl peptidase/L-asparaginase family protein [Salinibacter sp.]